MNELKVLDRREARDVAPIPQREVTPMDLLRIATSTGADLEKLEKLMDLQRTWDKERARKEYYAAIALLHSDPPDILKNKHVHFDSKSGGKIDYHQSTHDEVVTKVIAQASKYGLSHTWRQRQADGLIYVTCTIGHTAGHTESYEMYGPPDTSGLKSPLQAIASTTTFLQRYTLLGGYGLTSRDMGKADDVRGLEQAPTEPPPEGYEEWKANARAIADEQVPERLQEHWRKATGLLRRYVIKFDEPWWIRERDIADGKARRGEE